MSIVNNDWKLEDMKWMDEISSSLVIYVNIK